MQPFFTTSESEISRLEGLYIKERTPPAVIQGAFFGAVGIVGECVRGPVDKLVEVSGEARFKDVFGGRDQGSGGSTIVGKVWQALLNKPFGKLYIVRAAAAAASAATLTLPNAVPTNIIRIDASSPGTWGNNVYAAIVDATDGNANHFNLEVTYLGKKIVYKNLNTYTSSDDNLLATIGSDDANWVTVTKLANGRPVNAAAALLSTGTPGADGSIADSDFTASGRGLNLLTTLKGVGARFIAERSSASLKSAILTAAASTTEGLWIIDAAATSTAKATAITDAASYRDTVGRIAYAYNAAYTLDPETATEILTFPSSWLAAVLSQTDVDIHPGDEDTKVVLQGITRLYNESYTREDYISLKEAGICALEKDDGFAFVSGVTTSLTPGKEQITRRRMTDFLLVSPAKVLKSFVKKKNTATRRAAELGVLGDFLGGLKRSERVVEDYQLDKESVNTATARASGLERTLMRVKLISHILELVLEGEIGTSVTITERA